MALLPFKWHFPPGPWCRRWALQHSCARLSFSSPGKRGSVLGDAQMRLISPSPALSAAAFWDAQP